MKTFRKILSALLISVLLGASAFLTYFFIVTKDCRLDETKLFLPDMQICAYDDSGNKITGASGFNNRETVCLSRLSEYTKNAFICTEDKRFYSHNGFDFRRIVKALWNNLKAGSFKEGASTISQQLIKNTHLSLEKTVTRKMQEWKLTKTLERRFSKDEILETYLNTIYFGHNAYGIQNASEFYFKKDAENLTLGEAAILAGLVKSPNNYSPFRNAEKCAKRRQTVLSLMLSQEAISKVEYNHALQEALPTALGKSRKGFSYLHFALDELEEIAERKDFPLSGRTEIYTYLDPDLQSFLEEQTAESDAAYAVLDNVTHGFKAFRSTVGNAKRLPASAIKPLAVYAPALERGIISPATPVLDERTNFNGYAPENYGGTYAGYVSARDALSKSLNVPAVKILNALGVKHAVEALQKMRLFTDETDASLALALGGMKEGFSLKDLVSAYSVFSNDGKFSASAFIKTIKIEGQTVYERPVEQTAVFTPETAYLTTDMLKTAVQSGTAKKLRGLPFPIAAKTGTGGTKGGNTDVYTLSYTPLDTVGVWLGNADNSPVETTGGGLPCALSRAIHERLYERYLARGRRIEDFEKPLGVIRLALDLPAYEADKRLLLADENAPAQYQKQELFNAEYAPKERSRAFSDPIPPNASLTVQDGIVNISFSPTPYDFYEYTVERQTNGRTETLYSGSVIPSISDDTVERGKTYVYTIFASFRGVVGKKVILPAVLIKTDGTYEEPPKITKERWWEY